MKSLIKDNGNGTVTVRFFDVKEKENLTNEKRENEKYSFSPVYVTVKKQMPVEMMAKGVLWPKLFELAYASSGLPMEEKEKAFTPKDSDAVDFSRLENGESDFFLMQLTGKQVSAMKFYGAANGFADTMRMAMAKVAGEKRASAGESEESKKKTQSISDYKKKAGGSMDPKMAGIAQNLDSAWLVQDLFSSVKIKKDIIDVTKPEFMEQIAETQMIWLKDVAKELSNIREKSIDGKDGYSHIATGNEFQKALESMSQKWLSDDVPIIDEIKKAYNGNNVDPTEAIRGLKAKFKVGIQKLVRNNQNAFAKETMDETSFGTAEAGSQPDRIFNQIEQWRGEGKIVQAASQPKSWFGTLADRAEKNKGQAATGEITLKGMVSNHAYAVMGTRTKGSRRYVMLRNPWGEGVREYFVQPDKTIGSRELKDAVSCGIFLMEINDFTTNFSQIFAV